jgi:pilus assembly protein FimV
MTDSENFNDLDRYGVWVKKPPRTIENNNAVEDTVMSEITTELPDFSSLDTLTNDNLSENVFETNEASDSGEQKSNTENENISLDEFITGGFSDEIKTPEETPGEQEEIISVSDFFTDETMPAPSDQPVTTEDVPLDIDLSFNDSHSTANESDEPLLPVEIADSTSFSSEKSVSDDQGQDATSDISISEEIDLSEFGFDNSEDPAPETEAEKTSEKDYEIAVSADDTAISTEFTENMNDSEPTGADTFTAIPDTFDEETASLVEDKVSGESSDQRQEDSNPAADILKQIVGELSSLKSEIAGLKNDLADLKKRNEQEEHQEAVPVTLPENNGFFGNSNEDDTIALSGDELDNILSNADFTTAEPESETIPDETEQPPIDAVQENNDIFENIADSVDIPDPEFEPDTGLEIDFSTEHLEEPALDTIDFDLGELSAEDDDDSDVPEEISVPKVEDIVVESSSNDLMDAGDSIVSSELQEPATEPVTETIDADQHTTDAVSQFYEPDPTITETLTEDKIDYLSSDTTPAESDNTISKQADIPSIPQNLTMEIKSVLSYMDQLLENLPEEKIAEFAQSEQFDTYKKLFKELGLA